MSLLVSKTRLYISNSQAWGAWAFLLFLMSWLDKTSLQISWVGDLAVVLMAVTLGGFVVLSILNHRRLPISVFIIAGLIGLLILAYALSQVFNPIKGTKTIAQLFLVMLCFIGAALLLSRDQAVTVLAKLWVWLFIINLVLWVHAGFPYPFEGIFSHKNLLGGLTAFGFFFILSAHSIARSKLWWKLGILIGMIILLASGSRASWLVIIVAITTYVLWPKMTTNRHIFSLAFLLMLLATVGFVFIYMNLTELDAFSQMQALVLRYTGQRLDSGRQIFWPFLINAIQQRPWGYGPGATLEKIGFESILSSHNLYIQVALQSGIPGLTLLFTVLWGVWTSFFNKSVDKVVRLAGAFLLGALVHETFEVSLIQNNLTVGIVIWSIFGIGVGRLYLPYASENRC